MQSDDLSNKKSNNKQTTNEGLSGKIVLKILPQAHQYLKKKWKLTPVEMKTVQRARNVDQKIASIPEPEERNWNENESLSRGVSSEKKP
jgi:hypothetical protein